MRKTIAAGACLVAAVGAGVAARGLHPGGATASSHAEAPLISQDPTADNTDLYAFVSPDKPNSVTLLANWIPKEDPAGGPNFHGFSSSARYYIKIDNSGDARPDVTYRFQFKTRYRNPNTFLYATGPVTSLDDPDLNVRLTYTLTRISKGKEKVLGKDRPAAPNNVGPRSMPDYETLAAPANWGLPGGGRVFVGPRDDPFFVDLGGIFDLATIRKGTGVTGGGVDGLKGFNVHTIGLQLPIDQITKPGRPTIGVYASTERPTIGVKGGKKQTRWVQVSRLGNPLINEVVIPVGRKDRWNASDPANDKQFDRYLLKPELAADLNLLYGPSGVAAPLGLEIATDNRIDLLAVLHLGVGPQVKAGLPALNYTGPVHADLLRLNTSIPPSASPSRMGVLGGDLAGFPNGRRLADDVTDIELQAIGVQQPLDFLAGKQYPLGDGVDANDRGFGTTFPYAAPPSSGLSYSHDPS